MSFAAPAGGSRVSSSVSSMSSVPATSIESSRSPRESNRASEARWIAWGRSAFATAVALILIVLGAANIATRARWNEVEDGVYWELRPEGVTAVAVAPGASGGRAGIAAGDILLSIDGRPVQTAADVVAFQR